MTINVGDLKAKAERAQRAFEEGRARLYRSDGETRIFSDDEHAERLRALRAERNSVLAEVEAQLQEAFEEARAEITNLEHRDPTELLQRYSQGLILRPIASVGEPARRVFCRDGRQGSPYGLDQRLAHPCALLAHEVLDLAEGLLYGVQVRRVGGQEHKVCPSCFDELPDLLCPVRPEPVKDHHLTLLEPRRKEVLHVSLEGF